MSDIETKAAVLDEVGELIYFTIGRVAGLKDEDYSEEMAKAKTALIAAHRDFWNASNNWLEDNLK